MLENLEGAGVGDAEELEVWIKLGECIQNWCSAQRPLMFSHQCTTGD
jgi:hypothetical protein